MKKNENIPVFDVKEREESNAEVLSKFCEQKLHRRKYDLKEKN